MVCLFVLVFFIKCCRLNVSKFVWSKIIGFFLLFVIYDECEGEGNSLVV